LKVEGNKRGSADLPYQGPRPVARVGKKPLTREWKFGIHCARKGTSQQPGGNAPGKCFRVGKADCDPN
jgi:hypothetical protein